MTQTPASPTKTVYCTIAAANYLPRVQILRDSLRRHGHEDFYLLLIEHPAVVARLRAELPDYKILGPDEIGAPEWVHMAFFYDVMEYSTALKPALIRKLLGAGNVVYLDPDIEVFSPLTEIEQRLCDSDIVLTPHVNRPLPEDGASPTMRDVIRKGQFNLGFLGVRSTPENQKLMSWWHSVLIEGADCNEQRGTFTDQFWAAALVSFAQKPHILSSARYNLAYWNLPLHTLSWDGVGTPQTEDGPLGFYHYSGLERAAIAQVSKHQNRIRVEPDSPIYLLLAQYLNQIDRSPLGEYAALPYSFNSFYDGQPIRREHRQAFLAISAANRRVILNPFAEPHYITQLVAALLHSTDPLQALDVARGRVQQLEHRLNSLPHSVFAHMKSALNRFSPGSADRVFNLLQQTSRNLGPKLASFRQLIG